MVTQVSPVVAGSITKLSDIGKPDIVTTQTSEIRLTDRPTQALIDRIYPPLWEAVLPPCAGAIILMLLVYLLYKSGIFKRSRASSAPEKQPLNRNGYYNGDEAL